MTIERKYYAFAAHNRVPDTAETVLLVRMLNHVCDRSVLQKLAADPALRELLCPRAWRFATEPCITVYRGIEHRFQRPDPIPPLPLPTIEEEQADPEKRCQANAVRHTLRNLERLLPLQHLGRIDEDTFERIAIQSSRLAPGPEGMIQWEQPLEVGEMQQFVLEYEIKPETVGVVRVEHHARLPDKALKLIAAFNAVFLPHDIGPLAGLNLKNYELPKWASSGASTRPGDCGCKEHRSAPAGKEPPAREVRG